MVLISSRKYFNVGLAQCFDITGITLVKLRLGMKDGRVAFCYISRLISNDILVTCVTLNELYNISFIHVKCLVILVVYNKMCHVHRNLLQNSGCLDVKQRAGCLSYLEDPQGFRSLLAQTLTSETAISWSIPVPTLH